MKLVSMKLSAAERKQTAPSTLAGGEPDGPQYPWGLGLTLDDETLEKLALDDLPPVGTVMALIARVEVTGVSSNQGPDKTKRQSVSLQITHCSLEAGARETLEDALYGGKQG